VGGRYDRVERACERGVKLGALNKVALCGAFSVSHAGTFKLTLTFTEDYPNKAPTVRFESKMFHPNSASLCPGAPGTCETSPS
jgi:hypothetical protein